ncbi:MAG: bile acid:sodium symporter family protein [Myxococcales bacterium]|nr:bile acid:sodium symporter family protein [Myxococcales bacterium]
MTEHEKAVLFVSAVMATITFAIGLGLTVDDFRRLASRPRAVVVGLLGQLLLLPAIAFAVAFAFSLPAGLAMGIVLIAACPGGAHSNLYTRLAGGDVALSVGLTATSNALGVLTLPVWLFLGTSIFASEAKVITLSPVETITQLAVVLAIPLALGMGLRAVSERWAKRLSPYLMGVAVLLLVFLIVSSVQKNAAVMGGFFAAAGLPVIALNVAAMVAAFVACRAARLDRASNVAIVLEVGIQNATLAVGLAMSLSEDPSVLVPPIVYSLLVYLTGAVVIVLGRAMKTSTRVELTEPTS